MEDVWLWGNNFSGAVASKNDWNLFQALFGQIRQCLSAHGGVVWKDLQQPFELPSKDLGAGELKSSSQPFAFCFGQNPCQKNVVYVLDQFFNSLCRIRN